jgi:hypothetical protein
MPPRENDQIYYLRRARDCRTQAELTADPSVQQLHLQFATAYERRARTDTGKTAPQN